ncbi:MAG: hypothetical protein SH856_12335 [Flavobacteriales bacterium]|nr:hypothetical protein [Flavobacteriales bacterium]
MKVLLISIFLFASLIENAQIGKNFPTLVGETLEGKELTLPGYAHGKFTIVGLAWSDKAKENLGTWYTPMYDKFVLKRGIFDSQYDVNLYFVPMFIGLNQAAYQSTLKELKKSNRTDLFPYILFYKGEMEPYEAALSLGDKEHPHFFVLDAKGKIILAIEGIYTEEKMEMLEEVLWE